MILVGCAPLIPANTPSQLMNTPGVFVTITDDAIITPNYMLNYPPSWRVVKNNIASAPLSFAIVSPDDTMSILISESPLQDAIPYTINATTVYITSHTSIELIDPLSQIVDAVAASLRISH